MSLPLHSHLLSVFYRLDIKILSLFSYHYAIFPSDLPRFSDTLFISYVQDLLKVYKIPFCSLHIFQVSNFRKIHIMLHLTLFFCHIGHMSLFCLMVMLLSAKLYSPLQLPSSDSPSGHYFIVHFSNHHIFAAVLPRSKISRQSSTYNISFNTQSFIWFVTTSTTMAHKSGDKADPWCTPKFTSNSSEKCVPTFTFVLAPFYRLINAVTNASGIHLFLIAHSTTFLGTSWNTFFPDQQTHVHLLLFS